MRYPGSKAKLGEVIVKTHLPVIEFSMCSRLYVEPFVGSGAVLDHVLRAGAKAVWINDADRGIADTWIAVRDAHDRVVERIVRYQPRVQDFYEFKANPIGDTVDETAFRQLVLHQLSFSGLGAMAGGPIGGKEQSSQYNVGCRWNAATLVHRVRWYHRRLAKATITCMDFREVLSALPANATVYADPPYYVQGDKLYRTAFTEADHVALRDRLTAVDDWVLSYDDHEEIRRLYAGFRIQPVETRYTIYRGRRPKNAELIITPGKTA